MLSAASLSVHPSPKTPIHSPKLTCVKTLSESPGLTHIPTSYAYFTNPNEFAASEPEDLSIPIIDFSLLTSGDPNCRTQIIQDLGKACEKWGFFMVVNHGVPESLMKGVITACDEFFNLREEEKEEFEGKHVLDPIRCGTSFHVKTDKVSYWRDFLKVFVHPEFHFPDKPTGFSELSREYCKQTRKVARELLKGISESLGLDKCYIEKALDLESGLQVFTANFYPPCPQPQLAMGMPPHSDHGILTLLIQNEVGGLQLKHNGEWVHLTPVPNSILVNTGDHLEILSNGRYKSVLHRAVVNKNTTRISLAMANGPSLESVVSPALELLDDEGQLPAYLPMKYKDYLKLQQSSHLDGKACLDRVRI